MSKQFEFKVYKGDKGYSAMCEYENYIIVSVGDTFEELKHDMIAALELTFEPEKISMDQLSFTYDLESFFGFYRVINAKALSKRIGMNQSLLAQYIRGIKKPSPKQTRRILKGVHEIGRELCEVQFIEEQVVRPTT